PYALLANLGQHLAAVRTPGQTMSELVSTVASALRLPYVAVHLDPEATGPPVAATGRRPDTLSVFPLTYQGECLGALAVGSRTPGAPLPARDHGLLEALAAQAGSALHADRLTLDLQRSRQQLVSAREEERRRLRRDLHDGLGPALAGVALGVEAAERLMHDDPSAATAVLKPVQEQVKSAIADIRTLVEGLRPPALDELGLVDALRGNATRFEMLATRGGDDVHFSVEAP
ncbi:MAG: histidine kinase, partial [Actinomycetota bacterium]|nr:histidine kinase [Actinomycetota bacterium]